MKVQAQIVVLLLSSALAWGQQTAAPAATQEAPAVQQQQPQPAPAGEAPQQPVQQTTPRENVPLRVMVDKSLLVNTTERLKRVSVTDPSVADAIVVTPTQVLVHGRAPGEVSLVLWDEQERSRTFDLRVDVDTSAAAEEIHKLFPEQQINVSSSRSALVLSGHVESKEVAQNAGAVAGAYSKNVVNVLTFGPKGADEVLLQVRFAEVDRTALLQLGANLFSTGAGNTFGATGTQQFGGFTGSRIGAVTSDVQAGQLPPGNNTATSEINNQLFHQPASFGMNDLLNVFLFRTDANIGLLIKALKQKNALQILAEPNLVALNGKEASFLAGGEFPFPVVQQGAFQTVTIQFKEFGVRLKFTPEIMPNGNIHLRVAPEVSALDFTNALTISGFLIPALSTRRAETEFEMKDGQSFVIAGLMDNRLTNVASKVPGLGDIPILGSLFKSKNLQKSNTELMVLVTAHKVSPEITPSALPKFPPQFLDKNNFDGKTDGKNTEGGK
jgi:pilus assembly protein CpaC